MPPREETIVPPPERVPVEQRPRPPAPGRLQRPPHDHPATYIRPTNPTRANAVIRR
ncbi:hypothetical protein MSG28_005496 [Choristoneura fumiferana]|uniref:Uncharacterized protein n=1 Tax=Choristoneura fumiferana TaxID=7141 RepID=A0ACC0KZP9_CHOFU|nr:hypothetical protein MSG28_005496 [Choristoneura fumiferana]